MLLLPPLLFKKFLTFMPLARALATLMPLARAPATLAPEPTLGLDRDRMPVAHRIMVPRHA
jgi:hypothetical protein